jgi:phosphoglycerate dehydrogenase-like enzyme
VSTPLTVWCDARFEQSVRDHIREKAAPHQIVWVHPAPQTSGSFNNAQAVQPGADKSPVPVDMSEADVAFGQPNPQAVSEAAQKKRLRLVHITSAGYTRYDTDEFKQAVQGASIAFCNSSHVYDEPCAQHALAFMLALARELPAALDTQRGNRDWPSAKRRNASYLLNGQSVVMLGYGAIGVRLTELLAPFGMQIVAVRRNPTGSEGVETVTESQLARVLQQADHVMNLLPEADATRGFMTAERFAQMKAGARFYNIGRGATVDQPALREALLSGHVASAYLDVTDPEPLPADHFLWTTPNCYITPHTAGGHWGEQLRLADHFLRNLHALASNKPLVDQVF